MSKIIGYVDIMLTRGLRLELITINSVSRVFPFLSPLLSGHEKIKLLTDLGWPYFKSIIKENSPR